MRTQNDILKQYLEDAIAAEKSFETQLQGFSKEGDNSAVQAMFAQHAEETRIQYERLTSRLEALGGSPSGMKSFFAHLFNMTPKTAQIGHEEEERTTQNLMMAYAVENSEVAMYEALATTAAAAGDLATEQLSREIQEQERRTAEKVWRFIAPCALDAFQRLSAEIEERQTVSR